MKILSHRGYWKTVDEKNSMLAFERSFSLGFGTETDIRDYKGQLVISHDIPTDKQAIILLSDFFECYKSYNCDLPLALNIKSDGLQTLLMTLLSDYNIRFYYRKSYLTFRKAPL
jgi:glycerophosphoryl diester phosphodiesterase